MSLFLRLFLACGLTFGAIMSTLQGGLSSIGDFVVGLAAYGIPFGLLMAAVLTILQKRGEKPELDKSDRMRGDERWQSTPRRP
ncbi:MAG TPA: hypothetical protein VGV36_06965 [Solirubrobacteraceae bacterium]|nr:hypothetical protein [Solirubrobacteraceae bacterium]